MDGKWRSLDIADPDLPHQVLTNWLNSLERDHLVRTVKLLLDRLHDERIGFDAGIPGAG